MGMQGTITRLPPASNTSSNKKGKDKELAYKGLLSPQAPIVLPSSDGETAGGEGKGKDALKGGKFVDPDAGLLLSRHQLLLTAPISRMRCLCLCTHGARKCGHTCLLSRGLVVGAGMVAWTGTELSNPALVLEVSDTVEFAAVVDKPTKRVRAEKVRGMQRLDEDETKKMKMKKHIC